MYLPHDIVEYLITFIFDRRGYNSIEMNKNLILNKTNLKRIKYEIKYWKDLSVSVSWLKPSKEQRKENIKKFLKSLKNGKPSIYYHTGCFISSDDENNYHTNYVNKSLFLFN